MAENDVIDEFVLPKAGPQQGGMPVTGWGASRSDMKIRIRKGGRIEFSVVGPEGKEEPVVPTPDERAYVQMILTERQRQSPDQPKSKSADELRGDTADADRKVAEARIKQREADTPPDRVTVRTPEYAIGPEGQTATTKSVSLAQATYDRNVAADAKAALADLATRAQQAEANLLATTRLQMERDKMNAAEALAVYQKGLDAIDQDLKKETLALSRRAQEISVRGQDLSASVSIRGQDLSAGVSQRGQDMGYEQSMVGEMGTMARANLNKSAPAWQVRQHNETLGGAFQNLSPMVSTGPMYDPQQFVLDSARRARGSAPPQYALPAAPGNELSLP